jgi:hypothetical protein
MGFIVHPSKWEVDHARAIFAGQAYQASHDGLLPETAMWERLEFRYDLNPGRFAHWHPNIALMLEDRDLAISRLSTFADKQERHRELHIRDLRGGDEAADATPFVHSFAPAPHTDAITTTATTIMEQPRLLDVPSVAEPATALQGMTAVMLAAAYFARRRKRRRARK